jgi:hypothetical protein
VTTQFLSRLAMLTVLGSASVFAFTVPSPFRELNGEGAVQGRDDRPGDNGNHNGWFRGAERLPSGQYVTPTAIDGAVRTYR